VSGFKFVDVVVRDRLGGRTAAALVVCPECGEQAWYVYVVEPEGGQHLHYQCAGCGASLCDGSCGVPEGRVTPATYTCPKCGRASHHPEDLRNRYCGHCHEFERQAE
jgi:ribosomal protein S27AE